ncbi:hypothetical protein TNCV_4858161 [Trichonephila clavipes]|nr:hypothetical protein TNCV_4858161 [Trichonephila clavipes]
MVLKATANDRRHLTLCHDEFRGSRSALCRSGSENAMLQTKLRSSSLTKFINPTPEATKRPLEMNLVTLNHDQVTRATLKTNIARFTSVYISKKSDLLTHQEISRSIRPTCSKFGRHVTFVEQRSHKNEFCKNRLPRGDAYGGGVMGAF